jgi:pyrophosphatase PpaX
MNNNGLVPACVIFDMDGTLTQTNDLIFASFNHVAEKHLGRRFEPAEIIALFGPPEEGALLKVFGPENLDSIFDDLLRFYSEHHGSMAFLHQGMDELLAFLKRKGVKLAVFTGKGRRTAMVTLEKLAIKDFFDVIVSGNDVVHHKPHPEGILRVLDILAVDANEALMVGDSLSDVSASKAAGVRIAAVLWDSYDPLRVRNAGPDYVFERVADMLAWFRASLN